MPIPIFCIPPHILHSIVQKLNLRAYIKFCESSRKSFEIAGNVKTRYMISPETIEKPITIYLKYDNEAVIMSVYFDKCFKRKDSPTLFGEKSLQINDFPFRFNANFLKIMDILTEEFCIVLSNFLLNTNSTINSICFRHISCSPETFDRLLDIGNFNIVEFSARVPPEYARVEALKKVPNVALYGFLNVDDIMSLNAKILFAYSCNISNEGVNFILKEILAERRPICRLVLEINEPIQSEVVLRGIPATSVDIDNGKKNRVGNTRTWIWFESQKVFCGNYEISIKGEAYSDE